MNTQWHTIKVWLYVNSLTDNPNDYIGRVSSDRTLTIKDVCEAAVTRGGANISIAAMLYAVEMFLKEMGYQICDGFSINCGWFTASIHIKGVFNSTLDKFDPKRHTIVVELHQGKLMRDELHNIEVEVVGVAEAGVLIAQVIDAKTGSIDDVITPNKNLTIVGQKIRIIGDNPSVGVYFINDQGESIKVDKSDIVTNKPGELVILTPGLTPGTYHLSITTQFASGSQLLKDPRSTIFKKPLTAVPSKE
jgi:hypothetical protein